MSSNEDEFRNAVVSYMEDPGVKSNIYKAITLMMSSTNNGADIPPVCSFIDQETEDLDPIAQWYDEKDTVGVSIPTDSVKKSIDETFGPIFIQCMKHYPLKENPIGAIAYYYRTLASSSDECNEIQLLRFIEIYAKGHFYEILYEWFNCHPEACQAVEQRVNLVRNL